MTIISFIENHKVINKVIGTSRGADTAILLRPANARTFFDLQVMEILAKPRLEG